MTELFFLRAAGPDVPCVTIQIGPDVPPENISLAQASVAFEAGAVHLADALERSLPGGTLHALLIVLLRRKACLLRVPYA